MKIMFKKADDFLAEEERYSYNFKIYEYEFNVLATREPACEGKTNTFKFTPLFKYVPYSECDNKMNGKALCECVMNYFHKVINSYILEMVVGNKPVEDEFQIEIDDNEESLSYIKKNGGYFAEMPSYKPLSKSIDEYK